ncbi:hypothetical protein [Pseudoclavibacter sp. RFBB5]|uniref:hypothetical protein n=1 Tax=Pseudoclavibacter sp. RFBB5 TaxID=2080574 RepID=UPI0015E232D3|nr:hypothetical protein [Pseudoclavibacter sp. RFBB5]
MRVPPETIYPALSAAANDHPERCTGLALLPMSKRIEETESGDALVLLNQSGYWALFVLAVRPVQHEPAAERRVRSNHARTVRIYGASFAFEAQVLGVPIGLDDLGAAVRAGLRSANTRPAPQSGLLRHRLPPRALEHPITNDHDEHQRREDEELGLSSCQVERACRKETKNKRQGPRRYQKTPWNERCVASYSAFLVTGLIWP